MNQDDRYALIGSAVLLAIYAAVAYSCFGGEPEKAKAPKKEESKESTTVRQDLSSMWHRAKCAVRFCDEDGRCPVWSSRYSKCYMLDRDTEKFLKKNEKSLDKEDFEKYFVE